MPKPIITDTVSAPSRLTIAWDSPLAYAAGIDAQMDRWALLYSSMDSGFSGGRSLLALCPQETLTGDAFSLLADKLTDNQPCFANSWFGYLGYGLKHDGEQLPFDNVDVQQSFASALPVLEMTRYGLILEFDHRQKRAYAHVLDESALIPTPATLADNAPALQVTGIASPMSKAAYLQKVENILAHIRAGDIYQANLTRKFTGRLRGLQPDSPLALFARLSTLSPAPYSAYLKCGDTHILSSSPERFLTVDAAGRAESRPIKGTAARHTDPEQDRHIRDALAASGKDRAENLMIVDLMRNDLSRSCVQGSVQIEALHEVNSYETLHHMATTVCGQKRQDVSTLELVHRCFPPGSMTGAPKLRAMEICTQQERLARGVYSGAIGWFGGDGSVDLSVVIRTLLLQNDRFEFQVGGGIVADSCTESEWEETIIKARGIARALNIDEKKLRDL